MYDSSPVIALITAFIPLLLLLIYAICFGVLCKKLAAHKGYYGYFWTGFFLTLIGLIYIAALPVNNKD